MDAVEIIQNPNFQALAAMLRIAVMDERWRREHPRIPSLVLWSELEKLSKAGGSAEGFNRDAASQHLLSFLCQIAEEDSRLRPSEDTLRWLARQIDGPDPRLTLALLRAYATCTDAYYTAAELARVVGGGESTWRLRAAQGRRGESIRGVPGCFKRSKLAHLPRGVLLLMGYIHAEHLSALTTADCDPEELGSPSGEEEA